VTTDGAGNWITVWHSPDSLGGTIGTDNDILFARSTNNGATWSTTAAIDSDAGDDTGNDTSAQVTTDRLGNWLAAWESGGPLDGTLGTDYEILLTHSDDDGLTWTAPAALNTNAATNGGDDYRPQLATDGLGHWIAAWYSYDDLGNTIDGEGDILFSRGCLSSDTDGDGLTDCDELLTHLTDPVDSDTDGDGCSDGEELGPNQALGGMRDPLNFWDFFDVTGDGGIDFTDALDILGYFGDPALPSTPGDLRDRDVVGPGAWNLVEGNGGIDFTDVLNNLGSFGHGCSG
jgi:hypothetical protein